MGKELEALRKRIYNISNSYFPLDSFFNDICNIEDKDYDKEQAYKDIEKICSLFEKLLKEQERKEKLEKVWELINKNHITYEHKQIIKNSNTYEDYCYSYHLSFKITDLHELLVEEDQFNLLKEMLK